MDLFAIPPVVGVWAPMRGFFTGAGIGLPYGNCQQAATLYLGVDCR
jgi:hypothetical protein